MSRTWRNIFIATTAGLAVLLAVVVVSRHWIAEQVIVWQLREQGFPGAAVSVDHIGWSGARLSDLQAGTAISLNSLQVARGGWRLRDARVSMEGLRVELNWRDGQLKLGPFDDLLAGGGDSGDAAPPELPEITISSLAISVGGDHGPAKLELPGQIRIGGNGQVVLESPISVDHDRVQARGVVSTTVLTEGLAAIQAEFATIQARLDQETVRLGNIELIADIQPDFASIDIQGALPELATEFALQLAAAAPFTTPAVELSGYVALDDLLKVRPWVPDLPVAGGALSLGIQFGGIADLTGSDPLAGLPFDLKGDGGFQVNADLIDIARLIGHADLSLDGEMALGDDRSLRLHVSEAVARFGDINTAELPQEPLLLSLIEPGRNGTTLSVDDGTGISTRLQEGGISTINATGGLRLVSKAAISARFAELTGTPDGFGAKSLHMTLDGLDHSGIRATGLTLDIDGDIDRQGTRVEGVLGLEDLAVDVGALSVAGARATLPFTLAGTSDGAHLSLDTSRLSVRHLRHSDKLRLTRPLTASLSGKIALGPCTLDTCQPAPGKATLRLDALQSGLIVDPVGRVDFDSLIILAGPDFAAPERAMPVDLALKQVTHEEFGIARDIRVRGEAGAASLKLVLDIGDIAPAPQGDLEIPRLSAHGTLSGSPGRPEFSGKVAIRDSALPPAMIQGDAQNIALQIDRAAFADILDLPLVSDQLPSVPTSADGHLSATVEWDVDAGNGQAVLDLDQLSVALDAATVEELQGRIVLDSLVPPTTDGTQQLSVQRVDAGVEITEVELAFGLVESGNAVAARIADLSGKVLDGGFRFDPAVVHSDQPLPALRLHVSDLSLGDLTRLIGQSGVSLDGRVDGTVPFRIDAENRLAIDQARLAANAPGVLRLNLDSLRPVLAEHMGDQADLLLDALVNFHFGRLEAEVNKRFDADEDIRLRLEGRNPDHLDGQPFHFNINVSSNVIRFADTIFGFYRATLGTIEDLVRAANAEP